MYIEQGYKGNLGLWKYAIIPMGFLALMVFNYISTIMSPIPVDELMNDLIQEFGSNTVFVMLIAPLSFSLFLVLGWTKLVHSQSITSLTTSRKSIDWQRVFFSFALWGSITAAMTFTYVAIAPENYVINFQLKPFLILAFLSILLIPLQSSFEEYLFRGHLMQGLGILAKNRWVPLVVTSVLFGLMHLGNPEVGKLGYGIMIYYIGTGFFLGILTLMDEGLELALGFHAANNLITALLVTADWTAFQTNSIYRDISEPSLGWDAFLPIFVVFPILLFIFSKKYAWSGWTQKLFGRVLTEEEFKSLPENGQ